MKNDLQILNNGDAGSLLACCSLLVEIDEKLMYGTQKYKPYIIYMLTVTHTLLVLQHTSTTSKTALLLSTTGRISTE